MILPLLLLCMIILYCIFAYPLVFNKAENIRFKIWSAIPWVINETTDTEEIAVFHNMVNNNILSLFRTIQDPIMHYMEFIKNVQYDFLSAYKL